MQTPLVSHRKVPHQTSSVPPGPRFNGAPLLGFSHMVAPINKNESATHSLFQNNAFQGHVHQLLGGGNATPKVAPPLHSLLRECLERKQIQTETINHFLGQHPSLKRYDSAVNLLWIILEQQGIPPLCIS